MNKKSRSKYIGKYFRLDYSTGKKYSNYYIVFKVLDFNNDNGILRFYSYVVNVIYESLEQKYDRLDRLWLKDIKWSKEISKEEAFLEAL